MIGRWCAAQASQHGCAPTPMYFCTSRDMPQRPTTPTPLYGYATVLPIHQQQPISKQLGAPSRNRSFFNTPHHRLVAEEGVCGLAPAGKCLESPGLGFMSSSSGCIQMFAHPGTSSISVLLEFILLHSSQMRMCGPRSRC